MEPVEGYGRPGMMGWLAEFFRSDNTGGVFHGWLLAAVGFLVILVGQEIGQELTTTVWASRAVDYVEISPRWNVFAIAGAAISWPLSLYVAGRGVDRLGSKRMVRIGLPLAGVAVLLATIPAPGVLQFAFSVLAALGMLGAYVPAITALNHWFRDRLGLALALMLFGVSVGRVVVDYSQAALILIVDWWVLMLGFGAVIVAVAWPLARRIRDRPEDWGERPDGSAPDQAGSIPDYSWREAAHSRQFWMLMAAGSCMAVSFAIASVYDGPIISEGSATFEDIDKLRLYDNLASPVGILAGGLACCRWPVRYVLSAAAIAQGVGMALLLSGYGPIMLESAVLQSVASGTAVAPGIAAIGIYFGRRSFGTIAVTSFFIERVASSGLLAAAGYSTLIWGGYVPMFVGGAAVSLVGAGLFWRLGQPRLSPSQRVEDPTIS